jgi:surface antigen
MKTTRITALLISLMSLVFSAPVGAAANIGTYSFLRGTPAELFTDEDWKIFKESLAGALNDPTVGAAKTWENPSTRVSGTITILKAFKQGDADCRLVRITNQAKDRKHTSEPTFCKSADGDWKAKTGRKKGR